ncbi:MAG: LptF/LptG family permease [Duncaniella sp.]|uniref:LptF/LptG family permease n=1 Tax=Duncaniella sp. TaxID=2518496 RepID=UPI0023CA059C|nr:LptF/LptG family permease [Duncaniella sp.]MDE5988198.1 LptF/LptG family permease [Duncaniella sp.]
MLRIKRMDIFILQSFVPLFMMTFCICLFIVLMQFLWRYIDDLVGKGLGVDVIAELFFYAALTMIPMALPLAILLASLMTFGNLGEQFELTAMKASGISLLRTMAPLIVLMVMIATGAFFFQNDVLPVAQTKMWTLLYSMRQKSPELEIPEGVFYDQIPGYNLFVQEKNRETGVLYEMMIYDVSKGFENSSIILADSGKMSITPDKTHLFLRLWNGESFENIKDAGASNMRNVPYRRESFSQKDIMLKFDANFNRMDEQGMRSQYVGKNMAELQASIDSMGHRVDSIGDIYGSALREYPYMGLRRYSIRTDEEGNQVKVRQPDVVLSRPVDVDSVFRGSSSGVRVNYLSQALSKAERIQEEYKYKSHAMADEQKLIRRHAIELQKKFTLSFACVIFFFIGAPLGAIIRKGGLGTPLVISVFLFIFYYIIDNMGYKFARDGKWEVWEGMWLSAAVLLPLGIFFTYKAVNDSAVFNKDAYLNFFRKFFGVSEVRHVEMKDLVMTEVEPLAAVQRLEALKIEVAEYLSRNPEKQTYADYWLRGYDRDELHRLRDNIEATVEYLSNSREKLVVLKLMDLPILRSLWFQQPSRRLWLSRLMIAFFPVGVPVWLYGRKTQSDLRVELATVTKVTNELIKLISNS